jgi:hypothetical protein
MHAGTARYNARKAADGQIRNGRHVPAVAPMSVVDRRPMPTTPPSSGSGLTNELAGLTVDYDSPRHVRMIPAAIAEGPAEAERVHKRLTAG